jgi:arylsulfatase A-like enzyme
LTSNKRQLIGFIDAIYRAAGLRPHEVHYFEIMGNRCIYRQDWTAVTKHRTPWLFDPPPFHQDIWELHGPDDWSQAHNLAPKIQRN